MRLAVNEAEAILQDTTSRFVQTAQQLGAEAPSFDRACLDGDLLAATTNQVGIQRIKRLRPSVVQQLVRPPIIPADGTGKFGGCRHSPQNLCQLSWRRRTDRSCSARFVGR